VGRWRNSWPRSTSEFGDEFVFFSFTKIYSDLNLDHRRTIGSRISSAVHGVVMSSRVRTDWRLDGAELPAPLSSTAFPLESWESCSQLCFTVHLKLDWTMATLSAPGRPSQRCVVLSIVVCAF